MRILKRSTFFARSLKISELAGMEGFSIFCFVRFARLIEVDDTHLCAVTAGKRGAIGYTFARLRMPESRLL